MVNCYSRNMLPIWCVCDNKLMCGVGRHAPTKKNYPPVHPQLAVVKKLTCEEPLQLLNEIPSL
jgi:hypothetical protein